MQNMRVGHELLDHLDALQHLHADVCWAGGRCVNDQTWGWVTPKLQRSVRPQRENTWVELGRFAWLSGHRAHDCSNRCTPDLGTLPADTVWAC